VKIYYNFEEILIKHWAVQFLTSWNTNLFEYVCWWTKCLSHKWIQNLTKLREIYSILSLFASLVFPKRRLEKHFSWI